MKIDKETVIKQRFWFLLPVFAICLLVSWICVLGVRSETEKNYRSATDKDNALKKVITESNLKNNNWIEAMSKELEVSSAKKNELWDMEADRQEKVLRDAKDKNRFRRTAPFITWPDRTRTQWMKTSMGRDLYDMSFGEFLGNVPSDEYREEYRQQFEGVASIIKDWLNESNPNNVTGAVRVIGATGNHRDYVIPRLLVPFNLDPSRHVLSDEIYLLQEDLAIKREIFTSLADLLDSYSQLKTEWNEVPFTDIKEVAAPGATVPPAPGTPVPPAAGATAEGVTPPVPPAEGNLPLRMEGEPEIFQTYRFYNYIWPNLLNASEVMQDAKLKATLIDKNLPSVDPYKGWRLDFKVGQDPKNENKLLLHTVSGNHSSAFSLPVQPLLVWYSELGTDQEAATPLTINDAGGVGPSEYWPNATLKKISEKKLADISLPEKFGRITRVTRAMPENVVDQDIVFNNEWALNVQLLRRANNPNLTLRGEIINRSGRRLPVATFTAGLTLPNTTNLLQEEFKVATDAFNAGERRTFVQEIKNPIPPRSIAKVKQNLTWRSTPIKRIDRLELGALAHANSDRLKILPMFPYDFKSKDPLNQNTQAAAAPASTAGSGLSNDGSSALSGTSGMNNPQGGSEAAASTTTANNGIPLNRYVQVTSELRRMPVALVMVVDATAMTDIIAAMSNSRLRFQVTMAPWTKVPNLGRPGLAGATPSGSAPTSGTGGASGGKPGGAAGANLSAAGNSSGGSGREGASLAAGGGVMGAGISGGSGGATGPTGNQGPTGAGTPAPTGPIGLEDDSSVVELQIYGLVTVYESPDQFKRLEKLKANPPPATGGTATPAAPTAGAANSK